MSTENREQDARNLVFAFTAAAAATGAIPVPGAPAADLDAWRQLLHFAETVQIGSGTGFGFGNFQITTIE